MFSTNILFDSFLDKGVHDRTSWLGAMGLTITSGIVICPVRALMMTCMRKTDARAFPVGILHVSLLAYLAASNHSLVSFVNSLHENDVYHLLNFYVLFSIFNAQPTSNQLLPVASVSWRFIWRVNMVLSKSGRRIK